ncbi:MAG: tRNA lysidine(34) synthetase TilS [Alphaproteobacteria bacterium]
MQDLTLELENLFDLEMSKLGEFEDNPIIAVAVSGGVDSVALAFLANTWIKLRQGKIIALTINHNLRPESNKEAEQTKKLLIENQIEHHIIKWNYSNKPTSNIQNKAREARYNLLTEWCKNHNIIHLILAHHEDDQAETFMLRLERGSGLKGLACMASSSIKNGVRIVRPLLGFKKQQLYQYAISKKLNWIEDPSNQSDKYRRNIVRKKLNDNNVSSEKLANTAKNLGRARVSLEKICAIHLVKLVKIFSLGYAVIDFKHFIILPEEEALTILSQVIRTIGSDAIGLRLNSLERLYQKLRTGNLYSTQTLGECKISFLENKKDIIIYREIRHKQPKITFETNSINFDNKFKIILQENLEFSNTKWDYLTNQAWNKIVKVNKDLKDIFPKIILPTLPCLIKDSEILAIPSINYSKDKLFKKLKIYFNPHNTVTKNLFNYR